MAVAWIWIGLMCNSPEESMPKEAFYLYMAKVSLCTVTLLTLCVSLLYFLLRSLAVPFGLTLSVSPQARTQNSFHDPSDRVDVARVFEANSRALNKKL